MGTQFNVKLVGMKDRGKKARIGKEVVGFMDADRKFIVTRHDHEDSIQLKTAKGEYTLNKSLVANRYEGKCEGICVHVVLKAVSGKVIYWVK